MTDSLMAFGELKNPFMVCSWVLQPISKADGRKGNISVSVCANKNKRISPWSWRVVNQTCPQAFWV